MKAEARWGTYDDRVWLSATPSRQVLNIILDINSIYDRRELR